MIDLSWFIVFGGSNFCNGSVLKINGVTPCGVRLKPNHSIVYLAKLDFYRLIASPSLSSFS